MINLISGKICAGGYCLANPMYIYLIVPLILLLIFLIRITFVKFKKESDKENFVKLHKWDRVVFGLLRSIMLLLLLIAIASPYKLRETTTEGNPSLTILADNSSSFQIFDTTAAEKIKIGLGESFPVTLKYIASGERSAIGDGILQNAEGDDQILVISDGNNNYGRDLGDIVMFSSILNTTIHTVKMEPLKKDISIIVDGPSQVIEQSENQFRVYITNVGNVQYSSLEVFVDGNQVKLDSEGRFDWRFQKGYHKIMARINFPKDDYFSQNNIYYKSVKSLPRPKLLYVTEKSGPLQSAIEKVYEVDIKGSIPSELSGYDAIIINDIPAVRISNEQVDMIGNYVSDKGKGLIVVGGENSFDQGGYKDSYFESLLPVQVGSGERKRDKKYSVVFVIDLSGTTTLPFKPGAQQSILDFEKAFLFSMVNNLDMEDKISLIGFVSRPYCAPTALHCILTPISLIPDVGGVIQSISSPSGPDADRGTNIALALSRARQSLEKAEGSKNVVLISDGIDTNEYGIMHEIQVMNSFGIRLYNVGVGQFVNRGLLKKMAEQGNGLYFEPDESEKLKIMFMGDESEQKCLKATSGKILLMDNGHWITKGDMALTATAGGYNLVVPKTWGRKLVATDCDRTILTAGKYGLGSIAILSTDDGSKWSGQLFSGDNSKLITRMINWAIGDFTKDSEFDVRMNDVSLGKSTEVNVITNEKPEQKGFEFVKVDTGLYSAVFRPEKEGFEQILGATVAVSYNDEYERIGRNPQLDSMVALSGGKAFDVNDIEGIKDTVISMSRRVKIETINYRWPFVILALIIFLIDVLIRRIRENMGIANF